MTETDTKILNVDASAKAPSAEEPELTIEEIVTRPIVERIVKNANPDNELIDFTTKLGTQAGDNFMSIMYAVAIEVKSTKTGEKSKLDVMLKTIPRNLLRVQMINESQAFVKEARMYDTVFPALVEFQKNQGLKDDEIYQPYPICYASFNDGKNDYIAMQNLRSENFRMGCRHGGLEMEQTLLVIRNIAKFHALSYAKFQGDFGRIMEEYPFLEERMFMPPDKLPEMQKLFMENSYKSQAALLRSTNPADEEHAAALEKFFCQGDLYFEKMHKIVACPVPKAVIGHGDCWVNNFLFRYDEVTEKPIDFRFLDFQLTRTCSRAIDLGYFIYTSPQMEILNTKEKVILRAYFDEFGAFMEKLGVPHTETFEDFLQEFDEFRPYGVAMGLLLAPIISAQSGDLPDLEQMPDEYDEESANRFFGESMKSSATHTKVLNIAKNHLPQAQKYF